MTPDSDLFGPVPKPVKVKAKVPRAVSRAAKALRDARKPKPEVLPDWDQRADVLVVMYADKVYPKSFVFEQAREFAVANGLEQPAEPRNWGNVALRLAHASKIEAIGFAPTKTSRGSPKVEWRRSVPPKKTAAGRPPATLQGESS